MIYKIKKIHASPILLTNRRATHATILQHTGNLLTHRHVNEKENTLH